MLSQTFWAYDATLGQYVQLSGATSSDSTIDTWAGFWVQTLESADEPKLLIPSPQTIDDLTNFSDPQIDADDYLAYLQVPNYFDISVDPLDSGLLSILLRRIYLTFADDFDFVFVISNNTERPEGAAFGRFYN